MEDDVLSILLLILSYTLVVAMVSMIVMKAFNL